MSDFHESRVVTRSPLKVWWLCNARGYRVLLNRTVPAHSFLGGIRYKRTWELMPAKPGHRA